MNETHIKWIQPSTIETDEYFDALKKAYNLFHCFHQFVNGGNLIREVGHHLPEQEPRNEFICKKQVEVCKLPPKSMRLLGPIGLSKNLAPGACMIGKRGVGFATNKFPSDENEAISFKRESELDKTQAVACFHHDQSKKGTPFTTVTMLLALERPVLTPSFNVLDPDQVSPSLNEGSPPTNVIPSKMVVGKSIMTEPLQSIIDTWTPPSVCLCDDPNSLNESKWKLESRNYSNEVFQSNGFRLKCQAHEIHYDDAIDSKGYGISEHALSPNHTGINSRSHWSSKEYCTQLLSEERGSADFFHLLQNEFTDNDGGLINEPLISIIHMNAYDLKCIKGIKKGKFLRTKQKLHELRKSEADKNILSEKIVVADKLIAKRLHDQLRTEEELYFDSKFAQHEDSTWSLSPKGSPEKESKSIEIVPLNDEIAKMDNNTQLRGYGWRELPKSTLGVDFFELNKRKIQTSTQESLLNRCNKIRLIGKVDAKESIEYKIDDFLFEVKLETKFIEDVLVDRTEVSKSIENQQDMPEKLLTTNQQEALEHIINVPLHKPKTVLEDILINNPGDDIHDFVKNEQERKEEAIIDDSHYVHQKKSRDDHDSKVLLAVKHANYDALKEFIDLNGIDVDTYDEFGNTLFILACQQGNKKLCKFLLRRGAYINAQNHAGNTGLHYLFEYGHSDLAEYIRKKGADDSYLNAEGLTCFEGVHRKNLDAL